MRTRRLHARPAAFEDRDPCPMLGGSGARLRRRTVGAPSTVLTPSDPFPTILAELQLVELQALHSRVCRQLEREHLTDPEGPHPVTRDRSRELADELDTRQCFADPVEDVSSVDVPAPVPARRRAAEGRQKAVRAQQEAADEVGVRITDLSEVRPGDRIEMWHQGLRHCHCSVEEACPALGVVWIREAGDGYRRMLHVQDEEPRRPPSHGSR